MTSRGSGPNEMDGRSPKQVVLVGLGHTHSEIVRRWRTRPMDGAELTCVSDALCASYSGMLPGVLAGQYRPDAMRVDLSRLCAAAGARLVVGEASRLDVIGRTLTVDGVPVPFHSSTHFVVPILYASGTGRRGRSNQSGRRSPPGPGAGRVRAIHSL